VSSCAAAEATRTGAPRSGLAGQRSGLAGQRSGLAGQRSELAEQRSALAEQPISPVFDESPALLLWLSHAGRTSVRGRRRAGSPRG
jgi:hypothetical protein